MAWGRARDKTGREKTTADPYGMTTKKTSGLEQEDRPTGPYIEALVNPS